MDIVYSKFFSKHLKKQLNKKDKSSKISIPNETQTSINILKFKKITT